MEFKQGTTIPESTVTGRVPYRVIDNSQGPPSSVGYHTSDWLPNPLLIPDAHPVTGLDGIAHYRHPQLKAGLDQFDSSSPSRQLRPDYQHGMNMEKFALRNAYYASIQAELEAMRAENAKLIAENKRLIEQLEQEVAKGQQHLDSSMIKE
jgi:hypothetical protein